MGKGGKAVNVEKNGEADRIDGSGDVKGMLGSCMQSSRCIILSGRICSVFNPWLFLVQEEVGATLSHPYKAPLSDRRVTTGALEEVHIPPLHLR